MLDANVLITAKKDYYPFQRIPEFWGWLAHMGTQGAVKMPLEIVEEVVGGNDELAVWLEDKTNYDALCLDEDVDPLLVQAVINLYALDLNDTELIKIGRDPFLVAYALAVPGRTVVTIEASKPACQRANRRVPDICNDFGIQWCNSFKMLNDLDFSTAWRA